jgi:hypothetical protein
MSNILPDDEELMASIPNVAEPASGVGPTIGSGTTDRYPTLGKYMAELKMAQAEQDPGKLRAVHERLALLYPQAAMEMQDKRGEEGQLAVQEYSKNIGDLAASRDDRRDTADLLSGLSQAAAQMAGTSTGMKFSAGGDEEYQAKRQAMLQGLQAKLRPQYLPRMPGLSPEARAEDVELRNAKLDLIKAQTVKAGKTAGIDPDRTLMRLGDAYDKQTQALREREAQTQTLKTLLTENTPQSIEAAKTVMARLSGEVGALSNQDREAYAGSKAYIDQMSQFFTTKIAAEGFTPENKAAFEGLMVAFEKSIKEGQDKAIRRFEGRGQALKLAPGATTNYLTGGVVAESPAPPATAAPAPAAAPSAPAKTDAKAHPKAAAAEAWARANPNDPKAAEILKRLGK